MATQAERIQQKLYTEAQAGPFWPAVTDPVTKLLTVDTLTTVAPGEVIVGERSKAMGTPRRNRRTYQLEVLRWVWVVSCRFAVQVATEGFEKRIAGQLFHLPRDLVNGLEQVTLKLLTRDVFHPPQQGPNVGTQATYTFEAELSPV